jgi:hypothetical protein
LIARIVKDHRDNLIDMRDGNLPQQCAVVSSGLRHLASIVLGVIPHDN